MAQGQCFKWKYACDYNELDGSRSYLSQRPHAFSGRYVQIESKQIGLNLNEIIFRTSPYVAATRIIVSENSVVSQNDFNSESPLYTSGNALLDEQNTI